MKVNNNAKLCRSIEMFDVTIAHLLDATIRMVSAKCWQYLLLAQGENVHVKAWYSLATQKTLNVNVEL